MLYIDKDIGLNIVCVCVCALYIYKFISVLFSRPNIVFCTLSHMQYVALDYCAHFSPICFYLAVSSLMMVKGTRCASVTFKHTLHVPSAATTLDFLSLFPMYLLPLSDSFLCLLCSFLSLVFSRCFSLW